jgi:hypothetical protein
MIGIVQKISESFPERLHHADTFERFQMIVRKYLTAALQIHAFLHSAVP